MGRANKTALISYKGQILGTLDGKTGILSKNSGLTASKDEKKSAHMAGGGNSD